MARATGDCDRQEPGLGGALTSGTFYGQALTAGDIYTVAGVPGRLGEGLTEAGSVG